MLRFLVSLGFRAFVESIYWIGESPQGVVFAAIVLAVAAISQFWRKGWSGVTAHVSDAFKGGLTFVLVVWIFYFIYCLSYRVPEDIRQQANSISISIERSLPRAALPSPRPVPKPPLPQSSQSDHESATNSRVQLLRDSEALSASFNKWISNEIASDRRLANELAREQLTDHRTPTAFNDYSDWKWKLQREHRMKAYKDLFMPQLQGLRAKLIVEVPDAIVDAQVDYANPYNGGELAGIDDDFRGLVDAFRVKLTREGIAFASR